MSDPDLTALSAEALLEAFETLRISVSADGYTAAGYDQLGALRVELLRRLALAERFVRPPLWRQSERDAPPPAGTPEQP